MWVQPFGPILKDTGFSTEITDRNGELLRLSLASDDIYRIPAQLDEISPLMKQALLLYEDRWFYWHPGINPVSLARAFWTTYIQKHRTLGASTITMQLARKHYGLNTRSLSGKFQQMLRALQLEFFHSKREILHAYLNLAPYGFNIEGVGAASRIYFDKPADRLTLLEALTLTVIPQSPWERTKGIGSGRRLSKDLIQARHNLFQMWADSFPENVDQKQDMKLAMEMRHPRQLPFHMPHFTTRILMKSLNGRISTTVDLNVQKALEKVASNYISARHRVGIENASALLIDTRSMTPLAWMGSIDFFNSNIDGQVDGVMARRSPGSALKPFAYALAMEQGHIHPQTMLKDAPTPFGTYTPDNFDKAFSGPLSATEALIHSRNIPAVNLAEKLENPTLYEFLKTADIPLNPDPQHYGLSIVLGTAEVTMLELVELYALLHNEGRFQKLNLPWAPSGESRTVFSKETGFLTLDMLTQNPPPDSDAMIRWELSPQSIAWKTGTSVGFRDAWSVGLFDHYALAVWVGNFSGQSNSAFVGREAAGPLLFSLIRAFETIHPTNLSKPLPEGSYNLTETKVCALSGHLPHEDCPHKKTTWFIPGVSPISHCTVHRRIAIDPVSGKKVCPSFSGKTKSRVYEYWSSDIARLFKQAGVGRKPPPSLHPDCRGNHFGTLEPKILSPKKDIVYNLRTKGSGSRQIPLMAVSDGNIKSLSWYINNELVGTSSPQSPLLWKARAGEFDLRVVDEDGRASHSRFKVRWIN